MIHTIKGFGIVNKTEVFLELSCFSDDPADVGNLISGSSAFSKTTLNMEWLLSALLFLHSCSSLEYQITWPASWETYMQVRKQQLELDMEQQTGSK